MTEIVLTGARGLVGSRLLRLVAPDNNVTAVVRRPPPPPNAENVRWVVCDLQDPDLSLALPDRVDVVIHLAQGMTFRDFPDRATETFAINVASTMRLLDWGRRAGARQFILASTGSVYTDPTRTAHVEDEPISVSSLSFYAASKYAGEALALAYRQHFSVLALRPFTIYGPGQNKTMLVPRLIASIREHRPIRLGGKDGMHVNPIYVDDAAVAIVRGLSVTESAVVNLAGPEVLSLRAMSESIGAYLGVPPTLESLDETAPWVVGDIGKMAELLGSPLTRFSEAVPAVCEATHTPP